jgi:hypothetical protein
VPLQHASTTFEVYLGPASVETESGMQAELGSKAVGWVLKTSTAPSNLRAHVPAAQSRADRSPRVVSIVQCASPAPLLRRGLFSPYSLLLALCAGVSCRSVFARTLRFVVPAPAVVCISDVFAVEFGLVQPLVDDIMYKTTPHGCSCSRRYLRRVLGKHVSEMLGALSATHS